MIDAMPAILASAARTRSTSCSARPIPIWCASRARPIARAWSRGRATLGVERPCRLPRPVRRSGDAARLHRDVRRLRDALSQRGADDLGHARLQLRARQGGRLDALLACARSCWPTGAACWCRSATPAAIGDDDRRACWPTTRAGRRMRQRAYARQPLDDLGADGRALSRGVRGGARAAAASACRRRVPTRSAPRGARPAPADADSTTSAPCATTPACFQHAVHSVPDRAHGYCVDDNARALLLACALETRRRARSCPSAMTARFAAFVQHAWNPDTRRFRNFMSFDRRWLEDRGLRGQPRPDALGARRLRARAMPTPSRRRWAAALFARGAAGRRGLRLAARLGLHAARPRRLLRAVAGRRSGRRIVPRTPRRPAAGALAGGRDAGLDLVRGRARLRQCASAAGADRDRPARPATRPMVDAGLRALRWLMRRQTSPTGLFRPVGYRQLRRRSARPPQPFDQQPVEAAATISACLAAWRADGDPRWRGEARRGLRLVPRRATTSGMPLVDVETGSCRDGLHPRSRRTRTVAASRSLSYLLEPRARSATARPRSG